MRGTAELPQNIARTPHREVRAVPPMAGDARLARFLSDDELIELISAFPAVEFAFAYGSGVVKQQVWST